MAYGLSICIILFTSQQSYTQLQQAVQVGLTAELHYVTLNIINAMKGIHASYRLHLLSGVKEKLIIKLFKLCYVGEFFLTLYDVGAGPFATGSEVGQAKTR